MYIYSFTCIVSVAGVTAGEPWWPAGQQRSPRIVNKPSATCLVLEGGESPGQPCSVGQEGDCYVGRVSSLGYSVH